MPTFHFSDPEFLNSSILALKTHPYVTLLTTSLILIILLHFTTMSLFTHINKILYSSDSTIHRRKQGNEGIGDEEEEGEERMLRKWAYPSSSSCSVSGWRRKRGLDSGKMTKGGDEVGGLGKEGVRRSWTG
jgi:hypothetical protein